MEELPSAGAPAWWRRKVDDQDRGATGCLRRDGAGRRGSGAELRSVSAAESGSKPAGPHSRPGHHSCWPSPTRKASARALSAVAVALVYIVTNLNDSGVGSLRECVQASQPRTCVFATGGTITLNSQLSLGGASLTIAGHTAPGDGHCAQGELDAEWSESFRINRNDVIVRHVRFRRGPAPGDGDSVEILNAQRGNFG